MMTVQELNQEFGNSEIRFYTDSHGLICAELKNSMGKADIALHGAQLMSFIPAGQKNVLWMSKKSYFEPGKPIRGGIPVCWPWFGGHPCKPELPSHGFARISTWEVIASGNHGDAVFLELALTPGLVPDEFECCDFLAKVLVEVSGRLSVSLIIDNTGGTELSYSAALHSYFNISDISAISISGLAGRVFIDTLDDTNHVQQGDINFAAETDLVYLDTPDTCVIDDPGFKRKIRISKSGSLSTVVWNPWDAKSRRMPDFGDAEYHGMVCVETTNAESDARILAPNETHITQAVIELETEG